MNLQSAIFSFQLSGFAVPFHSLVRPEHCKEKLRFFLKRRLTVLALAGRVKQPPAKAHGHGHQYPKVVAKTHRQYPRQAMTPKSGEAEVASITTASHPSARRVATPTWCHLMPLPKAEISSSDACQKSYIDLASRHLLGALIVPIKFPCLLYHTTRPTSSLL